MLSICIPTYNNPNSKLVDSLLKQMSDLDYNIDLIVIDDASPEYKWPKLEKGASFTLIELESNIGRAAIRNQFLNYAKGDFLLFIDGDSQLISEDFLKNYVEVLERAPVQVLCGRSVYPKAIPPISKRLRWKYGKINENKGLEYRISHPYKSFMTNNFIVKKSILNDNPFDERLKEYGHEDTLMGYYLAKKGIEVKHIDNPVLNAEYESNQTFIRKSKFALNNLIKINSWSGTSGFSSHVAILKLYTKLKSLRLNYILLLWQLTFGLLIEKILIIGANSILLFSIWKLGELARQDLLFNPSKEE